MYWVLDHVQSCLKLICLWASPWGQPFLSLTPWRFTSSLEWKMPLLTLLTSPRVLRSVSKRGQTWLLSLQGWFVSIKEVGTRTSKKKRNCWRSHGFRPPQNYWSRCENWVPVIILQTLYNWFSALQKCRNLAKLSVQKLLNIAQKELKELIESLPSQISSIFVSLVTQIRFLRHFPWQILLQFMPNSDSLQE